MAQVIGIVKNLQNGDFFVKDAQGAIKALKVGDPISNADLVYGAPNNPQNAKIVVDVTLNNASDLVVSGAAQLYVDLSVVEGAFEKEEAVASKDSVDNAWSLTANNQTDPNATLDPTAAGALEETAAGDQAPTNAEQPGSTLFDARTGAIGNVTTSLRSFTPSGTDSEAPLTTRDADINDAPVAVDDAITVTEDVPFTSTINLNANDTDLDGDALTVIPGTFTTTAGGTIVIAEDGSYTYTPPLNFNGIDSVEYTVTDGELTDIGLLNITVTAVNDAPIPDDANEPTFDPTTGNYSVETPEDTPVSGQVVGSDVDGDPLTYTQASNPANGVVTVNPDGSWTYTPNPDYNGPDGFDVLISDGNGGTAISRVNIGVTPVNDAPVTADAANSVNEDAIVSGQLTASDIDLPAGASLTFSTTSIVTGLTFNNDGSYTFDANSYDALAQGEQQVIVIPFSVADDQGATDTGVLTITITGVNDVPVITNTEVARAGTVIEAGNEDNGDVVAGIATISGQLSASDVDNGATQTWSLVGTPSTTYGTMAMNAVTGEWTYTLNNSLAATQALAEGESATQTYTARITDDFGAFVDQEITITITGTNDVPVITNTEVARAGTVIEAGNNDDGSIVAGIATISGQLSASDVDNGATQTWSIEGTPPTTYGSISIDTTGKWTYTLDNSLAATQALAEGESATQTYTARVTDDFGAFVDQEITITITGTNDSPVISESSTITGTAKEAGNLDDGTVVAATTATGTMVATDVDNGATKTWTGSSAGAYGSFAIDPNTGEWVYTVDATPGSAADKLREGQSVTENFTVTVTDDKGAIDTQVVTITVQGTNDSPVAVADFNSVNEFGNGNFWEDIDVGKPVALGNLLSNDTDIDNNSDIDVSKILSVGTSQSDTTGSWLLGNLDVQGSYGTLVVNKETGIYSYTLNNANSAVNALNEGESLTDTFTYTAQDNNGAIATSTLTITINGTNDAPEISGQTRGTATEAGNLDDGTVVAATQATGTLVATDVDNDSVTWSIQGSATKTYGSFAIDASGNWTYTVDGTAGSPADKLAEGQTRTETFTVVASDNNPTNPKTDTQVVTIKILGTNDSPVISESSTITGTATEGGSSITGEMQSSDVDNNHTATWSGNKAGTYGNFSIDPSTGKWTYTIDNTPGSAADQLDDGETKEETFTVTVTDDKGAIDTQEVTITVKGTNDAPTISVNTGNVDNTNDVVKESGLSYGTHPSVSDTQATGTFTITDPDGLDDIKSITVAGTTFNAVASDGFSAIVGQTIATPVYGNVTIASYDGNGQFAYTYTLDTPVSNASNSNLGQDTFEVTVSDEALQDDTTVTIDIVDDIPTIETSGIIPTSFELIVTNYDYASSAGYNNSFGYYVKGEGGVPTTGVVIWDGVHNSNMASVDITGYTPSQIGFFIIPNGDNVNAALANGSAVTFIQNSSGEWQAQLNGVTLGAANGGHILFDSTPLNYDASSGAYTYVVDNSLVGNLNWEDIAGGGDRDNNDVNINAAWTSTGYLSVDESTLNIDAKVDFSQAFTFNFGADGAGTKAYELSIDTAMPTGLVDTATGLDVTLHVNGGVIEGRAGGENGEVVFTLSVGTDGKVTLDQQRAVVHPDATNPDDSVGLPSGLITLSASIVDKDFDTDSASLDIGSMIRFEDDAPVAVNDTKTTNEDAVSVSGDVLANDLVGADGAKAVNFTTTNGTYGTLSFDANGEYTYTLGAQAQTLKEGQAVQEIFNYTLTDKDGDTTQGKLTITVTGTNDAPVIDLDGVTNVVYTESFENLLTTANTWTVITNPTFTGDAGMTWTTEGGREGLEVQNGNVGSSLASDGNVHAELDSHELVTLSTTVILTEGTATLTFDYKPRPGSETDSNMKVTLGDETFTIEHDGSIIGASSDLLVSVTPNTTTGWMSVTVNASSLPLGDTTLSFEGLGNSNSLGAYLDKISLVGGIANDTGYETTFIENGTPVSIADIDIAITDVDDTHMESALITLTNPKDGDVLVVGTMPSGISATVSLDGNTITLSGHATIDDYEAAIRAITYKSTSENPSTEDRLVNVSVNDGNANSNTALTTVFVIPVNDAPDAVNDTLSGAKEDVSLVIQASQLVPTNDTDVDGDTLSITGVGNPTHGSVVLNPDGTITFTPEANFSGDATFEYTITDGELSDTATVTIHVDPVADAPLLLMSVGFNQTILGNNIVVNGSFEDVSGINENGTVIPNDVEIPEDGLVKRLEIPGWKLDTAQADTSAPDIYFYNGDSYFVGNSGDLKDSTSSANALTSTTDGYGISGGGGNDSVDKNETLLFDLHAEVTNASFDVTNVKGETLGAQWIAYDSNGVEVGRGPITDSTTLILTTASTSGKAFQYVAFDASASGNGGKDGFYVTPLQSTTIIPAMPAMEPHDDGHAGVGSTDGENYMDLGASPGNTAIYQEFTDLVEGQTYALKVDYRDKAAMQESGQSGLDSGVMQILWNGAVIATIDGNNTTAWETFTFEVTAASGTNKLTFNEIGVADDNWGIAIDNVRIYGETFHYELHVTATLTDNETLGHLIINGDTLPQGVELYQGTTLLVANADGDYEIELTSGTLETLTLLSSTRLDVDDINTIEASISSTDGVDSVRVTETALNEVVGTSGDDTINGTSGNDLIIGGAGADTINGGAGDDTIVYDAADSVIDGGVGEDTLLVPNDVDINFGALDSSNNPIENIETIDLEAGSHDLTNLSLDDVMDMTDSDNDLIIVGDAGDSVDLPAGTPVATDTPSGYDTYTSATDPTVTVQIEDTVHTI